MSVLLKKVFVFVGHIQNVKQFSQYRIARCLPLMGINFNTVRPEQSWRLEGNNESEDSVIIATSDDITLLTHYAKGLGISKESIRYTKNDVPLIKDELSYPSYLEIPVVMRKTQPQERWPVGEALAISIGGSSLQGV